MTPQRGGRLALFAAPLALGACVPAGHLTAAQAPGPAFDPIAFFAGHTEGHGSLKIATRGRKPTLVEGHGTVMADNAITLDQDVRQGDAKPTHRTWQLRRIAPGRYTGTLTDARGPVSGTVSGNRLYLRFAMKGGLRAEQWLYLRPDGQSAQNRMVVSKFGIPVASLDETIVRQP